MYSATKWANDLQRQNIQLQFDMNRQLANENREWQERMANSAHQREIKDLKAAGLNPVLTVSGGNGATTPSGSTASVNSASVDMSPYTAAINYEIAKLNSATQIYMHDKPSASTLSGALEYWSDPTNSGGLLKNVLASVLGITPYVSGAVNHFKQFNSKNDKFDKLKSLISPFNMLDLIDPRIKMLNNSFTMNYKSKKSDPYQAKRTVKRRSRSDSGYQDLDYLIDTIALSPSELKQYNKNNVSTTSTRRRHKR